MRTSMKRAMVLLSLLAGIGSTGCGRPFKVATSPGMVELDHQGPDYDYRAMTPEGVIMGIRVVDTDGRGDVDFWTRATSLRMRQLNGYALLASKDVKSKDGTPGRELDFGHDERGKTYLYNVRIFVAQKRLFVIESGGPREEVEKYEPSLAQMEASVEVRCNSFVSPVLASRTCHRW
jgi:hypothetical protein